MKNKILKWALGICLIGSLNSCSDNFFASEPGDMITGGEMKDRTEPAGDLNGMYAYLYKMDTMEYGAEAQHYDFGLMSTFLSSELWGQDMVDFGTNWFYDDYELSVYSRGYQYIVCYYHWNFFYKLIKTCNDVLRNPNCTAADKGQALAMRGFAYLNLVQLYQFTVLGHENSPAIPLILDTTDPLETSLPRQTVAKIYEQIESDLTTAHKDLASYNRSDITTINQQVTAGFLARMYLLKHDWTNAANYAHEARTGFELADKSAILEGFISMDKQRSWIWASHMTTDVEAVQSGIINFISHISTTAYGYCAATGEYKGISSELYDKIADNDVRKAWWLAKDTYIDYGPYPQDPNDPDQAPAPKYANMKWQFYNEAGDNCNDLCYMRAEEMILIEAEALAMNGDARGKELLIEFAKTRQPDYTCSATSPEDIRDAIWIQRRIELWGEGFAFYDLKRLEKPIVRIYEGSNHMEAAQKNFPANHNVFNLLIPRNEIQNNNGISEGDNNPMPTDL